MTHRFKLTDKAQLVEYSDDIELVFIELPKFTLTEDQLQTHKDRWLYFIKHAGDLRFIPEGLSHEPLIRQAFGIVNTAGLSADELEAQFKRHDFILLQRGSLKKAEQDGLKKGREQGRHEEKRVIARNLLAVMDDAAIADITGLTVQDMQIIRRSFLNGSQGQE